VAVEQEWEKAALAKTKLEEAETTIRTLTKMVVQLGEALTGGLIDVRAFDFHGDDEVESEGEDGESSSSLALDVIDGLVSDPIDEHVAETDEAFASDDGELSSAASDFDLVDAPALMSGDDLAADSNVGLHAATAFMEGDDMGVTAELENDNEKFFSATDSISDLPAATVSMDGDDFSVFPERETVDFTGALDSEIQAGAEALLLQDGSAADSDVVESMLGAVAETGANDDALVNAGAEALLLEHGLVTASDIVESVSRAAAETGADDDAGVGAEGVLVERSLVEDALLDSLIVVDNGSTDKTLEYIKKNHLMMKLIILTSMIFI
jgi:hypothetical protein